MEDRALLGSNPSAITGRDTKVGGPNGRLHSFSLCPLLVQHLRFPFQRVKSRGAGDRVPNSLFQTPHTYPHQTAKNRFFYNSAVANLLVEPEGTGKKGGKRHQEQAGYEFPVDAFAA